MLPISNSLIVALILEWCILGAVTGLLWGGLYRIFYAHRKIWLLMDLTVGACGSLAGALCSGWLILELHADSVWPVWLRGAGQFLAYHQTLAAILCASLLVLITNGLVTG